MRKTLFATLLAGVVLCACTEKSPSDESLQITADDVIHLEGTFEENFMDSWEYILLEDEGNETIVPGTVIKLMYDDGLYFIHSRNRHSTIKVYDSTGHYLNDISRLGRARNEYLYIDEWTLDRNKKEVLLITSGGYCNPISIKRFDYMGNYLGQAESDSLDNVHSISRVSKFMPDGSLLIESGISIHPMYDFYYLQPDGSFNAPMDKLAYHFKCDEDKIDDEIRSYVNMTGEMPAFFVRDSYLNQDPDTAFFMRILDNHIYKIWDDGFECVANLACLPGLPEKAKYNITWEDLERRDLPDIFFDMKDYVYVRSFEKGLFLYEKPTSKVYHMERDTMYANFPDHRVPAVYGNDIIAWVDVEDISERLAEMDHPDYNHRYSPDVEDFYRKARNCENPPIIIGHYGERKTK